MKGVDWDQWASRKVDKKELKYWITDEKQNRENWKDAGDGDRSREYDATPHRLELDVVSKKLKLSQ